jgi:uncharacterized membrane protein
MAVLVLTLIQPGQLQHLRGLVGITRVVEGEDFTTAVMSVLVVLGVEEEPTLTPLEPVGQQIPAVAAGRAIKQQPLVISTAHLAVLEL